MAGLAKIAFSDIGPSGKVLCLGAHCDDVEIGCGATLVELNTRWPGLEFHFVIFCSNKEREQETRKSIASLLGDETKVELHFGRLKDSYLPYRAEEAKDFLVSKVADSSPDLVFTHYRHDLHQDHRFVGEITYQVFRDNLILEMEVPKFDGDMGRPNVFVPVSEEAVDRKMASLMNCYSSQSARQWFSEETFRAILRLRGIECRSESGEAEAFYSSKMVIS